MDSATQVPSSPKKGKATTLVDTARIFQHPVKRGLYNLIKPTLERLLGVRKLNKLYATVHNIKDPAEFCANAYDYLGVTYNLAQTDIEKLQQIQGPLVLVCNHPFGGLEALLLIMLMQKVRPDYKIMANFLLGEISELRHTFIFVDPFDEDKSQQRNLASIKQALGYLKEGGFMGVFPAGEVASFKPGTGKIQEPPWNPNIARLIMKTKATVVPLYFHGRNSMLFQMASFIHPRLRTTLLIREFVNPRQKKLHYKLGSAISPEKIGTFKDADTLTAYLKSKTYILGTRYPKSKLKFDLVKVLQPLQPDTMEEIVPAVPSATLAAEVAQLQPANFLYTYKEFDVLLFQPHEAPQLMHEVGRLRELTFRSVGEGTGKSIDTDQFDNWYYHIVIWQREKQEVVGAYRVGKVDEILEKQGRDGVYLNTLFRIRPELFSQISPALELGRSWVRQEYQRNYMSLLLLWTGIGHFIVREPRYHSLIGPVSISDEFHTMSKDLMVRFLIENNYSTLKSLVKPRNPYPVKKTQKIDFYNSFSIKDLNDVQELISEIELSGLKVPVLIKHYLKMGGNIIAFNVDPEFNNSLDGLMYIDLRKTKREMLKKYMGNEGFAIFAAEHKMLG